MEFADGLPVTLRFSVEPKPRPPVPLITPMKRKSIDVSPSKVISLQASTTSQMNVSNIPESPNKSKWMNSLPSMFKTKKKQIRSSLSKEEKPTNSEASMINSFRDLSFSSDLVATEISQESYDIPQPKKSLDPVDYFTESDKNFNDHAPMQDNCIEEIYFIDPPMPFEVEKQEWNQLDVEIYDTQKNLLQEVNQKTGANYYVSSTDLRLDREIGSGEFGNVLRGVLRYRTGKKIYVAVKTLHKEHYQENLSEFLREASVMIKLGKTNRIKAIAHSKMSNMLPNRQSLHCETHWNYKRPSLGPRSGASSSWLACDIPRRSRLGNRRKRHDFVGEPSCHWNGIFGIEEICSSRPCSEVIIGITAFILAAKLDDFFLFCYNIFF